MEGGGGSGWHDERSGRGTSAGERGGEGGARGVLSRWLLWQRDAASGAVLQWRRYLRIRERGIVMAQCFSKNIAHIFPEIYSCLVTGIENYRDIHLNKTSTSTSANFYQPLFLWKLIFSLKIKVNQVWRKLQDFAPKYSINKTNQFRVYCHPFHIFSISRKITQETLILSVGRAVTVATPSEVACDTRGEARVGWHGGATCHDKKPELTPVQPP